MDRGQIAMYLTEPNYREHSQQRDLKDGSSGVCVLRSQAQHDPVRVYRHPVSVSAGGVNPEQAQRTAREKLPALR